MPALPKFLAPFAVVVLTAIPQAGCVSRPAPPHASPVVSADGPVPDSFPSFPDLGPDLTADLQGTDFNYVGSPLRTETCAEGDWTVALNETTTYTELQIGIPGPSMAAAAMDDPSAETQVAAFVLSRYTSAANIQTEFTAVVSTLGTAFPSGYGTTTLRASGTKKPTHDGFDGIQSTIVDMISTTATNASSLRNQIVKSLLGKTAPGAIANLPQPHTDSGLEFVLQFTIVRRFDRNAPSDATAWRLVVMGSIALKHHCQDSSRPTGIIADDLGNGTALTVAGGVTVAAGEVLVIKNLPMADIIWVADESGSMDDNREDIVNHANAFFARALASGLDFRMGVTNVVAPDVTNSVAVGKFCSRYSAAPSDDGGDDRFLSSAEQSIFSACIRNPPGYEGGSEFGLVNAREAVVKHLPRAEGDPTKIRPTAKLVVIIVTDEVPYSINQAIGYVNYDECSQVNGIISEIQPYLDLFQGKTVQGAEATVHVIGGVCNNNCQADVAHGYRELASGLGGQLGDVCQPDLGNTLQAIIDSIVGTASPLTPTGNPISASVSVTLNGKDVPRSRTSGFDYRANSNSLAFLNYSYNIGESVIINYLRWAEKAP